MEASPRTVRSTPTITKIVRAAIGVLDDDVGARRVADEAWYALSAHGTIVAHGDRDTPPPADIPTYDLGASLVLPGLVNAHSHAFQRSIRGLTHRRGAGDPDDFWSWRSAMYEAAAALDPDGFERVTRRCFAEMLRAGITTVGEFHYLHHAPGGEPYADPCELSWRVLSAAAAVGLRVAVLEVLYQRSGPQGGVELGQRRFVDASIDAYLRRCEDVAARCDGALSWLGVAPHSVRAVPRASLELVARWAHARALPLHIHVSEQARENEQCHAEHGISPTALLADTGCFSRPRGATAVHAIAIDDADRALLSGQTVCACPTTEADLGDGIVEVRALLDSDVSVALGTDSNTIVDLLVEARSLELHERLATKRRLRLAGTDGSVARVLLDAASAAGGVALGRPDLGRLAVGGPFDAAIVDLDGPVLADVPRSHALDATFVAGARECVTSVWVAGVRKS